VPALVARLRGLTKSTVAHRGPAAAHR
jgi:hypothetical protein